MTSLNWSETFRAEHQAVTLYLIGKLRQAAPAHITQPAVVALVYPFTLASLEHYFNLVENACPKAQVKFASTQQRNPTGAPGLEICVQQADLQMHLVGKVALLDLLLEDWEVPSKGMSRVWIEVLDEMQQRIQPGDLQSPTLFQAHLEHASQLIGQRLLKTDTPLRYRARLAHSWLQGGTDAERRARETALLAEFPTMGMRHQEYDTATPSRAEVHRKIRNSPWQRAKDGRRD